MDEHKLDGVERAAKAATPGPWKAHVSFPCYVVLGGHEERSIGGSVDPEEEAARFAKVIASEGGSKHPEFHRTRVLKHEAKSNAAYIAAASPDAILEMVRELRVLKQERDLLRSERLGAAEQQRDQLSKNRDQWERNSAVENKRAGDLEVENRELKAKVAELEGANAAHDAQVRREVLEKALNACCSICRDGRKHEGCPAQPIRALIGGGA